MYKGFIMENQIEHSSDYTCRKEALLAYDTYLHETGLDKRNKRKTKYEFVEHIKDSAESDFDNHCIARLLGVYKYKDVYQFRIETINYRLIESENLSYCSSSTNTNSSLYLVKCEDLDYSFKKKIDCEKRARLKKFRDNYNRIKY